MTGIRSWRRAAGTLTIGLLAALVAAGCGASEDSGDSASRADQPAAGPVEAGAPGGADQQQAPPDAATGAGSGNSTGNTPARAPEKLPPDERSIIYTGTVTVRPDDVNAAADQAVSIARTAGGFVGGDNRTIDDHRAEARVTLRVPAAEFTNVVTSLAKLGKELGREIKTEDVTEQVVDVTSRIATAQASVERVRALLARATALGEIVSLEAEVAKREAELESLKARLNKLTSLSAMSTITAIFVTDTPVAVKEAPEDTSGFLAGLKGGWNAFTDSLQVLLTVIGALLPWFVALGIPVLIVVTVLRRTAARRYPVTVPVPATANAAPSTAADDK
jgi:hypothetical protein